MEDPQLGYLLNSVSGKCDEQRRTGEPVRQCHSFSFSDYCHVSQSVLLSPVSWGIVYDSEPAKVCRLVSQGTFIYMYSEVGVGEEALGLIMMARMAWFSASLRRLACAERV